MIDRPKTARDFALYYRLSLRKVRELEKDGWLIFDGSREQDFSITKRMDYFLACQRPLSVEQLIALAKNPDLLLSMRHSKKAEKQLKAMGDIASEALPAGDCDMVFGAAAKASIALPRFAAWIASVIPDKGCGYHYIGTRALWNAAPWIYPKLKWALIQARKTPELAVMASKRDSAMWFARPEKVQEIIFDL